MKKPNIIIRMGAPYWDARVRSNGTETHFDIRAMDTQNQRKFIFEVVKAFRVAGERKMKAA